MLTIDDLKPQLLEMGICEVLIPLTNSPSVEVQGNSAAALGNLSSKGTSHSQCLFKRYVDLTDNQRQRTMHHLTRSGTNPMEDYTPT